LLFESNVPRYNILKVAGSSLGFTHSAETIDKMRLDRSGENHSQFGKARSPETKNKISEAVSGENHPMFGKSHSAEARALMSESKKGENHPQFGKTGENSQNFGKTHSPEARTKMSAKKGGGTIYVFSEDHTLENSFCSAREAAKYFKCSYPTILKYARNRQLFKEQWILSLTAFDE